MKKKTLSRTEKIRLLKGIASGYRSIDEITGNSGAVFLIIDEKNPDFVSIDNQEPIRFDEAKPIIEKIRPGTVLWLEIKDYFEKPLLTDEQKISIEDFKFFVSEVFNNKKIKSPFL